VETLNLLALERRLPVTKISFHAYGHVRSTYALLSSGAALGRGCGPLLVARGHEVGARLERSRIAIPGRLTSAVLLLGLYRPDLRPEQLVEMPFHRIVAAVAAREVDAGLIIHESRFTYAGQGLVALVDLGDWWEAIAGLPIPLGAIAADRRLGATAIEAIETALRSSVQRARSHPEESADFVRRHAQETSEEVTRAHIALYVNDFSEDLGEEGRRAVGELFRRAEAARLLPPWSGERDPPEETNGIP
jgi:1,4-dihydroxy-6-naphthoate synthase